ncbi:MAG: hypothetical protein AAFV43_05520 [Planctomycetota bacterium]
MSRTDHAPRRRFWRAALAALAVAIGCGGPPPLDERVRELATLPAASESSSDELRRAIATLRQQRGAPDQLEPAGFKPPASQNSAAQLALVFSDAFRTQISPRVQELVDSGERSPGLLENHAPVLRRLEAAAALGTCRFATDSPAGYFAPMRYLDDVALAARFELLHSRQSANDGDPAAAMNAWRRAMGWCHRLARVRRVSARVLAATLRAELLNELALQLDARVYGRYEAEQVYGLLRDQLADWPSDRRMLVGDRAMVAHAYEALRIGLLDRMVTLDERKRLRGAGLYDRLMEPEASELDADQTNYLAAMDLLIASAESAYHERVDAVDQAIELARRTPDVAAYDMFLVELPEAMLLVARDRSRCEAWSLALSAAADLVAPKFRTNPVNGLPYEAQVDATRVVVRTQDPRAGDAVCPRFDTLAGGAR